MEGIASDHLARRWSRRGNRRAALRLLAGAAMARSFPATGRRTDAQSGPGAGSCASDADCADGDPCTGGGAACVDGMCTSFVVDCVPGSPCGGDGACCPAEAPTECVTDAGCGTGASPCEARRCEGGQCGASLVSCAPGFVCCGNGDCCPQGDGCAHDADCPPWDGDGCTRASCVNDACAPRQVVCPPGHHCHGGACLPTSGVPAA